MAFNLLGMFQPQPDQLQTLLGEYYNPQQARMSWLGGTLQGLGAGLASGRPGAWAQGAIAGGNPALEDYQRRALAMYGVKQRADETAYQHGRDSKADQQWQQTFDYNKGRNQKADAMAQTRFGWEVDAHDNPPPDTSAPTIQSFYDDQGREVKKQWDYKSQTWVPIGGAKAPTTGPSMSMTLPDGTQVQMGNGGNASLPGEIGSRLGLGQQFLEGDLPQVMADIKSGDATGPIDYAMGYFGRGKAGDVQRRMASGVDALRRGLTGAGMSMTEAGDYARRYLPQWSDDAETLQKKAESLQADLNAVRNGAIMGKTGNLQAFLPGSKMFAMPTLSDAAQPQQQPAPAPAPDTKSAPSYDLGPDAIPENTPVEGEDGKIYMKRNGKLWRQNGQSWEEVTQ